MVSEITIHNAETAIIISNAEKKIHPGTGGLRLYINTLF